MSYQRQTVKRGAEKGFALIATVCVLLGAGNTCPVLASDKNEDAPIIERSMDYRDFTLKTAGGNDFNLRAFAEGKRLIIIGYVAGWCSNSNRNGHVLKRLHDKYASRGVGVVIVSEYSTPEDVKTHVARIGIDYPVVVETSKRGDRKKSLHYKYRRAVKDERKWGTPFYVIVEAQDLLPAAEGTPLARRVHTVSGEIIESEAEKFIEQRLNQ
jgi:hypothetical protein